MDDYPQIVSYYISATRKVFGHGIRVSPSNYSKFRVLEDDLRDVGADSRVYAYTVMTMLKDWAQKRNMNFLSVNMFCGDFAFKKFLKVWKSKTVVIEHNPEIELIHSEKMVAETYISSNLVLGSNKSFEDAVKELRPLLSKEWLEMFKSGKYRPCTDEVLEDLCSKYKVLYARDYHMLLEKITQGQVFNKLTTKFVKDARPLRVR